MRLRCLSALLVLVTVTTPALAARTILYYENECCRNITEGEFAILYVEGLRLNEPAQGWTVQSAAAALSSLGHQPQGGWVLSRFLSEAVMARLLKNTSYYRSPFSAPDFQKSDQLVTISNARSAVQADEGLTQGEFAILLAQALRLTGPQTGWTTATAITALSRRAVPLHPAAGWKPDAQLREAEMMQILAPTAFRPTSIDPRLPVAALQAYSVLFGKFEIATQGQFGLFVVNALGVPPPAGGWTQDEALKYIQSQFGVDSGYGWSASAPLCTETFDNTLRKIIAQLQPTRPFPKQGGPRAGLMPHVNSTATNYGTAGVVHRTAETQAQGNASGNGQRDVENFLNSIRAGAGVPSDRCALVPAQGLLTLASPLQPACVPCASAPCPPCP